MTQQTADFYQEHKHLFVKGIIDKSYCDHLVSNVRESIKKNEFRSYDASIPSYYVLSYATYFEKLLLEFQSNFESLMNKRLHPTYTCCRMYHRGDFLPAHTDQDSCEYSATITLGMSNNPWEFCVSKDGTLDNYTPFKMDVGDCVLYNGKILHWRTGALQGDWHCQVFLHYVDADGPYSKWIYNGREKLNL